MANDALMVGIVLTLVFGSILFYVYNRLCMAEKKMNLVEGVLTDLKIMMDSAPFSTSQPFASGQIPMMQEFEPSHEYLNAISGPIPLQKEEIEEVDAEQEYQQTLEEAIGTAKTNDVPAPYRNLQIDEAGVSPAINVTKLSPDLESMSVKELQALAKQKGLTIPTGSRRKQVIELLKGTTSDVVSASSNDLEGQQPLSGGAPLNGESVALQDTTL